MTYAPGIYFANELGTLSRWEVVNFLYSVQGSVCLICNHYLRRAEATIDHVVPRAQGGAHHILNWALAHSHCNRWKGHRMPTFEEFKRHRQLVKRIRNQLFKIKVSHFVSRVRRVLRCRP
ncbi:HNH endonuclease [Devosia crocina]|uniref:HNH endonuclease n=1 Tax=Devosia crocina TaxID=429728 RepID=A0A1I7N9V7_9HYPH|nr:HNH endonuclease signature motif containing protein [Devosia crocina]SFV31445.1 HNH endonuclease [Devosia crocina]